MSATSNLNVQDDPLLLDESSTNNNENDKRSNKRKTSTSTNNNSKKLMKAANQTSTVNLECDDDSEGAKDYVQEGFTIPSYLRDHFAYEKSVLDTKGIIKNILKCVHCLKPIKGAHQNFGNFKTHLQVREH